MTYLMMLSLVINQTWWEESRYGTMDIPKVGPAGEVGEMQVRPIFVRDVERISGYRIQPANNNSVTFGCLFFWHHYVPLAVRRIRRPLRIGEYWQMYNEGYEGFASRRE